MKDISYTRRSVEEGKKFIGIKKIKFIIESVFLVLQYKLKSISKGIILKEPIFNTTKIQHLGMILDGNRRYRKKSDINEKIQHLVGSLKTLEFIEIVKESNINYLTLYLFAENNWKRDKEEVNNIMKLLNNLKNLYFKDNSILSDIKLKIISTEFDNFDEQSLKIINDINNLNRDNIKLTCNMLISYSGQKEIINASNKGTDFF